MNEIKNYWMPPLPLSFDRVNEGLPAVSDCSFFNVPIEILGLILQHVIEESLPCLSLVIKDCRQLARSRQFATVHPKYSNISRELVTKLLAEGTERAWNGGRTVLPSIGACVRQIFVMPAKEKGNVMCNRRTVYSPRLTTLQDLDEVYFVADDSGFYDDYISAVQELVSNHNILPHLSLMTWTEMVFISPSVLRGLACSSVQHLRFCDVSVKEDSNVELPTVLQSRKWPLRTLAVEFYRIGYGITRRTLSQLFTNILHLCSATLESLSWERSPTSGFLQNRYCSEADMSNILHFPRLRYLRYSSFVMQDSPYLRALVPDNLRALELEIRSNSFTAQFFQKRGSVPSLDTLVWYTDHPEEVYLLDFLRDNTHLSRLDLPYSQTEIFLETQLLPLLASSFTRLTSLSLCWSHSYISLSGLELIGTLHSLQQIYLHVAEDEGSMPDWLNHHRAIQPFLGQLTCLRKLAFGGSFCDYTTPSVLSPSVSVDEDIDSAQPDEDTIPAERDEDNHEDLHEQQVLSLANEYVPLLPELEWLYIGQLQMHVAGGSEPEHRSARIFPQAGRTPYHTALQQWTLIRDLFGREKDF